jgi:NADH-quinone oxidoreductase subunit F
LKEIQYVRYDAAAWPVAAAIRHFREEFEYHGLSGEKKKK